MEKYGKYIIAVIAVACIIAISVIYNVFYDKAQIENTNSQVENKISNTSVVEEKNNEVENMAVENTSVEDTNIVDNQISEEAIVENVTREDASSIVYEQDNDIGSTDRKQEAINLVKQKWGEDDTVTFRCDQVTNNGEYIIAVTSKISAKVLNYFRVNIEKESVIVDY